MGFGRNVAGDGEVAGGLRCGGGGGVGRKRFGGVEGRPRGVFGLRAGVHFAHRAGKETGDHGEDAHDDEQHDDGFDHLRGRSEAAFFTMAEARRHRGGNAELGHERSPPCALRRATVAVPWSQSIVSRPLR